MSHQKKMLFGRQSIARGTTVFVRAITTGTVAGGAGRRGASAAPPYFWKITFHGRRVHVRNTPAAWNGSAFSIASAASGVSAS